MSGSHEKLAPPRRFRSKSVKVPKSLVTDMVLNSPDPAERYADACRLGSQGNYDEARRAYADLEGSLAAIDSDIRVRALVQNELAAMRRDLRETRIAPADKPWALR